MPFPLEQLNDGSIADHNFRALARDMNPPVPQARVFNNANLSINNGVATTLTFNSERYDNGGLHSTSANTSRLLVPITGLYMIGACVQFAVNATGYRYVDLLVTFAAGGTATIVSDRRAGTAVIETTIPVETEYELAAGDYVEVVVAQSSGGALNVLAVASYSPEFWMHRVGGYVNQGV